jgi:hypothetical protein
MYGQGEAGKDASVKRSAVAQAEKLADDDMGLSKDSDMSDYQRALIHLFLTKKAEVNTKRKLEQIPNVKSHSNIGFVMIGYRGKLRITPTSWHSKLQVLLFRSKQLQLRETSQASLSNTSSQDLSFRNS